MGGLWSRLDYIISIVAADGSERLPSLCHLPNMKDNKGIVALRRPSFLFVSQLFHRHIHPMEARHQLRVPGTLLVPLLLVTCAHERHGVESSLSGYERNALRTCVYPA